MMRKWIAQNITYLIRNNGCASAARRGMLNGLFTCVLLLVFGFVREYTLERVNKSDSFPSGHNYKMHPEITCHPFLQHSMVLPTNSLSVQLGDHWRNGNRPKSEEVQLFFFPSYTKVPLSRLVLMMTTIPHLEYERCEIKNLKAQPL